jgi:hypothetical protein
MHIYNDQIFSIYTVLSSISARLLIKGVFDLRYISVSDIYTVFENNQIQFEMELLQHSFNPQNKKEKSHPKKTYKSPKKIYLEVRTNIPYSFKEYRYSFYFMDLAKSTQNV